MSFDKRFEYDMNILDEIWKDANFETSKKVYKNGDTLKRERITQKNKDNIYISYCKICNCEIRLSCKYNGEFPLCMRHRDPNDRPIISNK